MNATARQSQPTVTELARTDWDLIVIGGGITGAGIARIAADRGLSTLLVEQKDFAWGTSSRSSKMVHGGLRYLGSGQYRLTRDAVRERQRMLEEAPGLVEPLHYIMPHYQRQFPGPRLFGLLLWLYDKIAGRRNHDYLPGDRVLDWVPGLRRERLKGGTRFADAGTDDARLVLRLIHEAESDGATIRNYVRATAVQQGEPASVTLEDAETGESATARAGLVVSATGAWTDALRQHLGADKTIRPLRGSHLVVPFWRLPVASSVTLMHPDDGRAMFIFPWEGMTVIGTTDLDHEGDLNEEPVVTEPEYRYMLTLADHYFPDHQVTRDSIVASWSGVRPVVSTNHDLAPSDESREHEIWDDGGVVSVAGGKLTTFRLIAEEVLATGAPYLAEPSRIAGPGPERVFRPAPTTDRPAGLSSRQWHRLKGYYGPDLPEVLTAGPLTRIATTDTLWAELIWAAGHESVRHLDDLLLRRTRIGMLLPEGGRNWLDTIETACAPVMDWTTDDWGREKARYLTIWRRAYYLPREDAEAGA